MLLCNNAMTGTHSFYRHAPRKYACIFRRLVLQHKKRQIDETITLVYGMGRCHHHSFFVIGSRKEMYWKPYLTVFDYVYCIPCKTLTKINGHALLYTCTCDISGIVEVEATILYDTKLNPAVITLLCINTILKYKKTNRSYLRLGCRFRYKT